MACVWASAWVWWSCAVGFRWNTACASAQKPWAISWWPRFPMSNTDDEWHWMDQHVPALKLEGWLLIAKICGSWTLNLAEFRLFGLGPQMTLGWFADLAAWSCTWRIIVAIQFPAGQTYLCFFVLIPQFCWLVQAMVAEFSTASGPEGGPSGTEPRSLHIAAWCRVCQHRRGRRCCNLWCVLRGIGLWRSRPRSLSLGLRKPWRSLHSCLNASEKIGPCWLGLESLWLTRKKSSIRRCSCDAAYCCRTWSLLFLGSLIGD